MPQPLFPPALSKVGMCVWLCVYMRKCKIGYSVAPFSEGRQKENAHKCAKRGRGGVFGKRDRPWAFRPHPTHTKIPPGKISRERAPKAKGSSSPVVQYVFPRRFPLSHNEEGRVVVVLTTCFVPQVEIRWTEEEEDTNNIVFSSSLSC